MTLVTEPHEVEPRVTTAELRQALPLVTVTAARRQELEQLRNGTRAGRGYVVAAPRRRPATRTSSSRWLPSERVLGFLLLVVAIAAGVALLFGLLPILVAPE